MKTAPYTTIRPTPHHLLKGDSALNKAALDAHNIVKQIADAAIAACETEPAVERAKEHAHRAVNDALAEIAPALLWINEQLVTINAMQKKSVDNTRAYVAANPLKSVGIALAIGFLISRVIRK